MQLRDLFNEIYSSNSSVIPFAIQQMLREPLNIAEDWQRTEKLLLDAREALPDQIEIIVALYKMYAYTNRFEESLALIQEVLDKTSASLGFSSDWRQLIVSDDQWVRPEGPRRWFLYSLKAAGFVNLRNGNISLATEVLNKLLELDPMDEVGGSVVYDMASRLLEDAES